VAFDKSVFYNFDKLYSFNAVLNMLVGGRGLGKTYGAKKDSIRAGIKKGEEFIYLRRYKDELKTAKETFFADIAGEFPDYDFRYEKHFAQYSHIKKRDDKKREWITIGYFIALSTAQSQKSVAFPKVRRIIFDEFIIEKGMVQYLPNEAEALINFYSTVNRTRDEKEITRVYMLANSVTISNPYFLKYDIEPKPDIEWIKKFPNADGVHFLVCHFPDDVDFKKEVYKTRFGQFILESDKEYADYAVGNSFKDNHNNLLARKLPDAGYVFSLETKAGTYSIWRDWKLNKWYIQESRPKQEMLYTVLPEKMSEGKKLLFYSDKQLQVLRAGFKAENVYFDKAKTRQGMLEIFAR